MAKKYGAKRDFDLAKDAERVHHYLDIGRGFIGTNPSTETQLRFASNQDVPFTLATNGPAFPLRYELSRTAQRPSVADRTYPVGMLQRLVQGKYHVILSEHQVGLERVQYMRLGARPFEAFEDLPAHERIAYSKPRSGELKIAHPDHAHAATAWLLQGKSIRDLNPDGTLKDIAKIFGNQPFV